MKTFQQVMKIYSANQSYHLSKNKKNAIFGYQAIEAFSQIFNKYFHDYPALYFGASANCGVLC